MQPRPFYIYISRTEDEVIIMILRLRSGGEEVGSEANNTAALEDIGHNADLYIANQEGNTQN